MSRLMRKEFLSVLLVCLGFPLVAGSQLLELGDEEHVHGGVVVAGRTVDISPVGMGFGLGQFRVQANGILQSVSPENELPYLDAQFPWSDEGGVVFAPWALSDAVASNSIARFAIAENKATVTWRYGVGGTESIFQIAFEVESTETLTVSYRYQFCEVASFGDNLIRSPVARVGLQWNALGYSLPSSGSDGVSALCRQSNAEEAGVWRLFLPQNEPPYFCGDGSVDVGEACDDGNLVLGDGCSPTCLDEPDMDNDGLAENPGGVIDVLSVYDQCVEPNCIAEDADGDGVVVNDNCIAVANPLQHDFDGDGLGDLCDDDRDGDSRPNDEDLCPNVEDEYRLTTTLEYFQDDLDGDGLGDLCDTDRDGDGVDDCDPMSGCPPSHDGLDNDRDGKIDESTAIDRVECGDGGDVCSARKDRVDSDLDGRVDEADEFLISIYADASFGAVLDNCPKIYNPQQADLDGDGIGDACDADRDDDRVVDCGVDRVCSLETDGRDNDRDDIIDENAECALGCVPASDLQDNDRDGRVDEANEMGPVRDLHMVSDNDNEDNCPKVPNQGQVDSDGDGEGDACDDADQDGVPDGLDNCAGIINPDQANLDGDAFGDACDQDLDGDAVVNQVDNCPALLNPLQTDLDGDGMGNACDDDDDGDGLNDVEDNCPRIWNPQQNDGDEDGEGDACDVDRENDGVLDCGTDGICRYTEDGRDNDRDARVDESGECADGCLAENDLVDNDQDGQVDEQGQGTLEMGRTLDLYGGPDLDGSEDNCPLVSNSEQADLDGDKVGDACDPDLDDDGVTNTEDNCPEEPNIEQMDLDGDGLGDACDPDVDNDGRSNFQDNCGYAANPDQIDTDGDGKGDVCDGDDDADGLLDEEDACPLTPSSGAPDSDDDGTPDVCDDDRDGDGVENGADNCPAVANPNQLDDDEDGVGNFCQISDSILDRVASSSTGCSSTFRHDFDSALFMLMLAFFAWAKRFRGFIRSKN